MAFFHIGYQSLPAATFCSLILLFSRSVNGGTVYTVGGDNGWKHPITSLGVPFDYQNWASRISFAVNDGLDFGPQSTEFKVMLVTPATESTKCNDSGGTNILGGDVNTNVTYNFTGPGQFGFINPYRDDIGDNCVYCVDYKMRFMINVTSGPLVPAPAPGPYSNGLGNCGNGDGSSVCSLRFDATKSAEKWTPAVYIGIGAVGFLFLATIGWMTRRKLRKKFPRPEGKDLSYISSDPHTQDSQDLQIAYSERLSGPYKFSFKQLKEATNSFNSELVVGEGGFGTVYQGYLGDPPGIPVAVKRMSQDASHGAKEFQSELRIISQLRHRNLVQLLGWCDDNEELILVYEYMPNRDLDDHIFGCHENEGCDPLSWELRYKIFCGVATALVYLHEEWEQRVVHRDIKTSNVMLDSQYNARLGDFGLARLSAHSQVPRTTEPGGTYGYVAPELNLMAKATDKSDVYAFGVVLLEVSCARRPLTPNCNLVDWVWELHKAETLLDAIDPKLEAQNAEEEKQMKRVLQVGLLCCHPDPTSRPSMRHVLNILKGETPLPKIPRAKPVAVFIEEPQEQIYR